MLVSKNEWFFSARKIWNSGYCFSSVFQRYQAFQFRYDYCQFTVNLFARSVNFVNVLVECCFVYTQFVNGFIEDLYTRKSSIHLIYQMTFNLKLSSIRSIYSGGQKLAVWCIEFSGDCLKDWSNIVDKFTSLYEYIKTSVSLLFLDFAIWINRSTCVGKSEIKALTV